VSTLRGGHKIQAIDDCIPFVIESGNHLPDLILPWKKLAEMSVKLPNPQKTNSKTID
jgi:hypothetical protein